MTNTGEGKMLGFVRKWGGWVVTIVVATVAFINYIDKPVSELENRVQTIESDHLYFQDKLDKSFVEFKASLDKNATAVANLEKAVVRLETLMGVKKTQ